MSITTGDNDRQPRQRPLVTHFFYKDSGWVRVGCLLLHWKCSAPLFSERHGFKKYHRIPFSKWRFRLELGQWL